MALSALERAIADTISHHRGKDAAITSSELAERLQIENQPANPVTRETILDVIRKTNMPILACNQGYFVAETSAELNEYVDNLRSRRDAIDKRIELVMNAYAAKAYDPTERESARDDTTERAQISDRPDGEDSRTQATLDQTPETND